MKKTALILSVLALVVLIATPSMKPKKMEKILLPGLDLTDVTVIKRISPISGEVTLFYDPKARIWRIKELDGYPAYTERVREILFGISTLQPLALKTDNKDRYAELELDEGKAQHLILADSKGKVLADLWIGNITVDEPTSFRAFFIRKDGEDRTYLAIPGIDVSGLKEQFAFPYLTDFSDKQIKDVTLFTKGKEVKVKKTALAGFLKGLDFRTVKRDTGEKSDTVIRFIMNDMFDVNITYLKMEDGNWVRIEVIPTSNVLKDNVATLTKALSVKHAGYVYKLPHDREDMIAALLKKVK